MSAPTPARPPAVPREAATVMLLRDGPDGLEVFMVVRHDAIRFASGAMVFPGGSVDAADRELAGPDGNASQIAAFRETFEECGILLARPEGAATLVGAAALSGIEARHRTRLAKGATTLAEILRVERLALAFDALIPFAHWITPESQPKRFDTQFFLAAAPPDQVGAHDGLESVDSLWITPQRAVSQAAAGHYKLVFATQMNLLKLARHRTVGEALDVARSSRIVPVMPIQESIAEDGTRHLRIPLEAGYGGDLFVSNLRPAGGG